MLDWRTCQICCPLEIKLSLLYIKQLSILQLKNIKKRNVGRNEDKMQIPGFEPIGDHGDAVR